AAERERQQALRVEPGALDPALGEVPGRPAQEVEHGPGLLLSCRESADFARCARCARLLRRRWPILQAVGSADFARLRLAARDRFAIACGILQTIALPRRRPGGLLVVEQPHAQRAAGALPPPSPGRPLP